jgi:hypothetical protein
VVAGDGEVKVHFNFNSLPHLPEYLGMVMDPTGQAYGVNIVSPPMQMFNASLDRFTANGSSTNEMLDSTTLYGWTAGDERIIIPGTGSEKVAYDVAKGRVLLATVDNYATAYTHILALTDTDHSNTFNSPSEMHELWNSQYANVQGFGSLSSLQTLPNGDVLFTDTGAKRIYLLHDTDGNGDFNGMGETKLIYDAAMSHTAGGPVVGNIFSSAIYGTEL